MKVRAKDDTNIYALKPGQTYEVLGLDDQYFRVLDLFGEPILFSRSAFIVLDENLPEDWEWKFGEDGDYYADPPGLHLSGFYEDWFDRKEPARATFAAYLKRAGITPDPPEERQ